jgi:hypothetical protein
MSKHMTPIEHYWPPEMMVEVFPEKYGHLIFARSLTEEPLPARYAVDRLPSGCVVIELLGGQETWRAAHKPETSSRDEERG